VTFLVSEQSCGKLHGFRYGWLSESSFSAHFKGLLGRGVSSLASRARWCPLRLCPASGPPWGSLSRDSLLLNMAQTLLLPLLSLSAGRSSKTCDQDQHLLKIPVIEVSSLQVGYDHRPVF